MVYIPNVVMLNQTIADWTVNGISFCGILHSHLQGIELLSQEDMVYIQNIMEAMPKEIKSLYFPIVVPNEKMIPFVAYKGADGIIIQKEAINIIHRKE